MLTEDRERERAAYLEAMQDPETRAQIMAILEAAERETRAAAYGIDKAARG